MKVSIIVPVYNAENTIRKCVESILYGKEKNIEIILINDFSKDKSYNVCQKLQEEYDNVILINNSRNLGVSASRNKGLEIAKGEFILFVDSDDYVSKNYVYSLTKKMIELNANLIISGFYYHNYIENTVQDIIWNNINETICIKNDVLGIVYDKWLLPQLWNKIFKRETIIKYHLKFDESLSMGEDFLFVLDYMEAIKTENIYITNEKLYHYIRYNNNSLMGNFHKESYEDKVFKIDKLYLLINDNYIGKKSEYENQIQKIKEVCAFYIIKSDLSKKEKIKYISKYTSLLEANELYKKQYKINKKEKIFLNYQLIKKNMKRIKLFLISRKNKIIIYKTKKLLNNDDYSIISQNCIGGVFYHDMNQKFLSPTINLFFDAKDFIKFIEHLDYYLNLDIKVEWDENYPIGYLDDIKIHFMHYDCCSIATKKWNERKKRLNMNKLIILNTDRDGFDDSCYEKWKKIKYSKILFTHSKKYKEDENSIFFNNNNEDFDLITMRLFYDKNILIKKINNLGR